MKRLATLCAVMGVMLVINAAWAEDYNPPPWRGDENTAFVQWLFNDGSYDLVAPDFFLSNPALAAGTFSIEYDPPDTVWLASREGADSVWRLESPSNITMELPNFDNQNPYKEIWMQLTYQAEGAGEPFIYTDPLYTGEITTSDLQVNGNYWNITYHILIEPNPASETIWIQPQDCTLYLDQIVIDTICATPNTVCIVDFSHFAKFADHWLDAPCDPGNNWCAGADIDHSGDVDRADLGLFVGQWLHYCPYNWPLK